MANFSNDRIEEQTALILISRALNTSLEGEINAVLDEIIRILSRTIHFKSTTIHLSEPFKADFSQPLHSGKGTTIPIQFQNKVYGVLRVRSVTNAEFTESQKRFLKTIGFQIGLALSNRENFNKTAQAVHQLHIAREIEMQQKVENLKSILEISSKFLLSSDLQKILNELLEIITDRLKINGCAICLLAEDQRHLKLVAQKIADPTYSFGKIGEYLPLKDFVFANQAVQTQHFVYIEDVSNKQSVFADLWETIGLKSTLDIPMISSEKVLGVLHVNQYGTARKLQSDEIEFIQTLGNQAAIAIVNTELLKKERNAFKELKKAQEQLVRVEKLSAIGELSAAIAHEIRNPLGAILNSVSVLERDVSFTGIHRELIKIVIEETERIKQIIDDFLIFARPRKPLYEKVNLIKEIRSEIEVLKNNRGLFKNVKFELAGIEKIDIDLDRHQMREVLENLFLNAAQAMHYSGNISIHVQANFAGQEVVVSIWDSGKGMNQEVLEHLFEPFYSTKSDGTGLGLSIVKRIIEEHGGSIRIESVEEKGACAIFRLPLHH